MASDEGLLILKSEGSEVKLLPRMANRHGLIAGATGTGKTITLRLLAERLSAIGVPVFMADVKGDISGVSKPGGDNPKAAERAKALGLVDFKPEAYPVVFWDVFGERGHPVRATVSDMGPLLLARLLGLNETQTGILNIIFRVADDEGLLILDLKDLRAMAQYVADNAAAIKIKYGNVSAASVGAVQRAVLGLEDQGAAKFFGEPALDLHDLIQTDSKGRGVINILSADKLMNSPKLYASFLIWMLAELFEQLPEVGDQPKPKLVLFFDEAHLLFDDIPKVLEEKIEQVVRLIRSKGVGVYFVTQNPLDLPETVLGQLGNRVQHALRAFTPKEQKAVKVAAETFRQNPGLDAAKAITEMGVGEALISVLDEKGTPTMVERGLVCPPQSRFKPLEPAELSEVIKSSVVYGTYEKALDRESAFEKLTAIEKQKAEAQAGEPTEAPKPGRSKGTDAGDIMGAFAKSAARAIGSQIGRQIIRGVLGSILGGGGRGRR